MLKPEDMAVLREAVRRAAAHVGWAGESPLRQILLPFWSDAIHEMLKRRGCPCAKGQGAGCFLELSPEERIARFAVGSLSLDNFVAIYEEARAAFFASLPAAGAAAQKN